jgi:alkylation response protein AidB-like acyl-CoA dehydrogenase
MTQCSTRKTTLQCVLQDLIVLTRSLRVVQTKSHAVLPGGGFLLAPIPTDGIFTREKFDEDNLEIALQFLRFYENEVLTQVDAIDRKEYVDVDGKKTPIAIKLLREAGELGMLSAEIPEEYEGLGLDVRTGCLFSEFSGGCSSFAVTMGAHTGIGTLPIVYFGNIEQKKRFLPPLSVGEIISCYALTEPGAGSDALSGRTAGVLSDDGTHYVVNGEKIFISNGNWADIAIVFTRIDGLYSCLIVDLHADGVSRGAEEHKMGQLGSSTTALIFEDVKVPVENLLGDLGDASRIALNILNLGRLKLGFGCLGSMKYAINKSVTYGGERKQFGQPIITFDMQKARLAQMVIKTYAVDALSYRIAGEIDDEIESKEGGDKQANKVSVVRRHALEASICKILGSENLHYVAQNAVFIHGGYGYLNEYQVERLYRDNIVDMIYEGTNDVNRMVIFNDLIRNIFGAEIPFRDSAEKLEARIRKDKLEAKVPDAVPESLAGSYGRVMAAKSALLYTLNHCLIACGKNVRNEQQVMRDISDSLIHLYSMDSTLAKVIELVANKGARGTIAEQAIARLVVHEGLKAVREHCSEAILGAVKGGELERKMATLSKLMVPMTSHEPIADLKRTVANAVIEAGKYCF